MEARGDGRGVRLFQQLSEFEPLADEQQARADMLALIGAVDEPLSRHHFDPGHFTVGAFVVAEGHILLVHHRRMGIWLEPGGHIDPTDSTMEDAAFRELTEETAVSGVLEARGIFDIDVHEIPAGRGEPTHNHYNIGYLFGAVKAEPKAQADEVHAVRWVPLDEVAALNTDAAMLRAVAKLQGRRDAGTLPG